MDRQTEGQTYSSNYNIDETIETHARAFIALHFLSIGTVHWDNFQNSLPYLES